MVAWTSVCSVLPRGFPVRLVLTRQRCSLVSLVSSKVRYSTLGYGGGVFPAYRQTVVVYRPHNVQRRLDNSKASDQGKGSQVLRDIVESHERPQTQLTVGAKVAQAGKDVSYFGIIIIGFGVTGALLWFVVSELFFGFSANKVYAKALKKVKASAEVVEAVGEPIMGHGETTSRGRRRHVSYQEYLVDGENYMRVKFYLSGSKRKGTVHVDVKQTSRGNFDYRFILVELTGHPHETIVVLDNR